MSEEPRSKAPFVVFGGMLLIALCTVLAVVIGHCTREEPYLDADEIAPGQPGRVHPQVEPPADQPPSRPADQPR